MSYTDGRVGNLFERRLIEAYISEHGKDPVTGDELSVDDLIEIKTTRVVRPRPPALTSIPALLSAFQNEWDALALETYQLQSQLAETRQELSTALYQHDAAVRVIARLSRERDEARDALSKVTITSGGVPSNGDAMQVDGDNLPEALAAKVDATQEKYESPVVALLSESTKADHVYADFPKHAASGLYQKTGRLPSNLEPTDQRSLLNHCFQEARLSLWTEPAISLSWGAPTEGQASTPSLRISWYSHSRRGALPSQTACGGIIGP
jgi:hypothetical protein